MSKPDLLEEMGVTRTSLENAARLQKELGPPVRIELRFDPGAAEWYQVKAMYDSGDSHVFTGFAWGYWGEGPRGLLEFCQKNSLPLTQAKIVKLNRNKARWFGVVWPEKAKLSSMGPGKVG